MKTKNSKKWTVRHCLGNMVGGLIQIIDGVILLITFGRYVPSLSFKWAIFRLKNGILCDSVVRHDKPEMKINSDYPQYD